MRSSTLNRVLGIFLIAILLGGLIGWWASRTPLQPAPTTESVIQNATAKTELTQSSIAQPPVQAVIPAPVPAFVSAELDAPSTWEDKLDEILGSDDDEAVMGEKMLAMMPNVGEEAQIELAGHIVNLIDDEQFMRAAQYLTNAAVPESVSSVFMDDLYNRDNALKLPLILEIARNEQHALREDAKDLLELYIEEDYGTNWTQWEAAMKTWLQENPDQ